MDCKLVVLTKLWILPVTRQRPKQHGSLLMASCYMLSWLYSRWRQRLRVCQPSTPNPLGAAEVGGCQVIFRAFGQVS